MARFASATDAPELDQRTADYVRGCARLAVSHAMSGNWLNAEIAADAVAKFHPAYGRDVHAHVDAIRRNP